MVNPVLLLFESSSAAPTSLFSDVTSNIDDDEEFCNWVVVDVLLILGTTTLDVVDVGVMVVVLVVVAGLLEMGRWV